MDKYIVLPLLIPLFTAIITMVVPNRASRRWVMRTGMVANLCASFWFLIVVFGEEKVLVSQAGGWPAPYGISLVIDPLSALMLTISALLALCVTVYADITIDLTRERFGFLPMLAFMMMGINLAFSTGDIFNLYVSFEIMLTASFGLLVLGDREAQIKGGIKYMVINLFSSTIFVVAIGLTYGVMGTLNIAHLVERAREVESPGILTILTAMYFVAFGIKAAIFPFFFWLPASYHTPPVAVTAIFGGILTKVGIYGMLRVLVFIFPQEIGHLQNLWLVLSGATMLVGVLGALKQHELRRVFSFLIISHVGFIMMGISFNTRLGLTAAIFYMIHHMIVKTALFMAAGLMEEHTKTKDLTLMGDLMKKQPVLAVIFFIGALSLAGIPPLSGFFAKFALLTAAWSSDQFALGLLSLVVSLVTLIAVMRVWQEGFWKSATPHEPEMDIIPDIQSFSLAQRRLMMAPVIVLVGLSIAIGLMANTSYRLAERTADQLLDSRRYTDTVLQDFKESDLLEFGQDATEGEH